MMNAARYIRLSTVVIYRQRPLQPSSANLSLCASRTFSPATYTCCQAKAYISTGVLRFMHTTVSRSRLFRVSAATSSVVTLLVLSAAQRVATPLLVSQRHHSDSGSDSDGDIHHHPAEETVVMQKPVLSPKVKAAKAEALYGMLAADAMAMPVHWFYNPDDIPRHYGKWLTAYTAPNSKHPSSILNLSAVDGSGRGGGSSTPLIGNIILHDKVKFWKSNSCHYHQGMSAGDSTLNSVVAVEMVKTMVRVDPELTGADREVRGAVLQDYVALMTTPGSHGDTYAESFHRAFFKDWVKENPRPTSATQLIEFAERRSKDKLKGSPDSQLSVIGALVPAIPWILRSAHRTENECAQSTVDFIRLTHPVAGLLPFVDVYARLLHAVINGHDLKDEVLKVLGHSDLGGPAKRERVLSLLENAHRHPKGSEKRLQAYQSATSMLGMACYIEGAMSSMLLLALEFHDDVTGGVLANANCGGENCHRGAALGALLGAAAVNRGEKTPAALRDNLHSMKEAAASVVQAMSQI